MLVSRWCYQSGLLKVIGQFSHNGVGCQTRVKFVIGNGQLPSILCHITLFEFCLPVSFRAGISPLQGTSTCCQRLLRGVC